MKAIIYVRAREQEKKQEQIDKCYEFVSENDLILVGVYEDLKKVLKMIENGETDILVITDKSRITRNAMDYYNTAVYLLKYKVQLVALNESTQFKRIK